MDQGIDPTIFVIPVPRWAQPRSAPFRYPRYARDFGVEQDAFEFLTNSYPARALDPTHADFLYLPVFWTRLHLNNNYASSGIEELSDLVRPWMDQGGKRLLTVCQYDDGPVVDLGDAAVFLSSRKTASGLDAPLLASPLPSPRRRWRATPTDAVLASFLGRSDTHPIRAEMFAALEGNPSVQLSDHPVSPREYARLLRQSPIALAPRGYGGSSFRFYEALQVGAVPWLIGDIDSRPFKSQIPWEELSYYSPTVTDFRYQFDNLDPQTLDEKRRRVAEMGLDISTLGRWQRYWIDALRSLSRIVTDE